MMILKSRAHYFLKYEKEHQKVIIRVHKKQFEVTVSHTQFHHMLDIAKYFKYEPKTVPVEWRKQPELLKALKTLLSLGVIYRIDNTMFQFQQYIWTLVEDLSEDVETALNDIHYYAFEIKSAGLQFFKQFIQKYQLTVGEEPFVIYGMDRYDEASEGDLCIYDGSNYIVIFAKYPSVTREKIKKLVDQTQTSSKMFQFIAPIQMIRAFMQRQAMQQGMMITINSDGTISELNYRHTWLATYSFYERKNVNKEEQEELSFIQNFEKSVINSFGSELKFNDEQMIFQNQYGLSSYAIIKENHQTTFLTTSYASTYKKAASHSIKYGLGKILRKESGDYWVSDHHIDAYYSRALMDFIPKESFQFLELTHLPEELDLLKKRVESVYKCKLQIILKSYQHLDVGKVLITNTQKEVLYESGYTVNLEDEIDVALCTLLKELSVPSKCLLHIDEVCHFKLLNRVPLLKLYENLRLELRFRNIKEYIWGHEGKFSAAPIYVGKFREEVR